MRTDRETDGQKGRFERPIMGILHGYAKKHKNYLSSFSRKIGKNRKNEKSRKIEKNGKIRKI